MNDFIAFKPLSKEDIAELLGISVRTLENWVNDSTLPSPTKLGNRVYWHPRTFFAWLDRRLSEDSATDEGGSAPATATANQSEPATPRARNPRAPATTKIDKLRSRTERQLRDINEAPKTEPELV